MHLQQCTTDCHNFALPCRHRSTSAFCLKVRSFNTLEAEANRLTDVACEDQRDDVEAAHTAFKILHANFLREREEVYQSYLKELRRQQ